MGVITWFKDEWAKVFGAPTAGSVSTAIEEGVISIYQGAVSIIVASPIGAVIAADIKTLEASNVPIADRLLTAAVNSLPSILEYIGNPALAASQATSIGIAVAQEVFNKVESTNAGTVALAVLNKAGVTVPAAISGAVVAAAGAPPVKAIPAAPAA